MTASFKDKYGSYAIVLGASAGIGKAFAEELASKGVNLILVARRLDRLEQLSLRLRQSFFIEVRSVALDLLENDAVDRLAGDVASLDVGLLIVNETGEAARRDDGRLMRTKTVIALTEARTLVERFHSMIRMKVEADLDAWLTDAGTSLLASSAPSPRSTRRTACCTSISKDAPSNTRSANSTPWCRPTPRRSTSRRARNTRRW